MRLKMQNKSYTGKSFKNLVMAIINYSEIPGVNPYDINEYLSNNEIVSLWNQLKQSIYDKGYYQGREDVIHEQEEFDKEKDWGGDW